MEELQSNKFFACSGRANAARSSSGKAVEIACRKRNLPTTDSSNSPPYKGQRCRSAEI